MFPVPYTLDVKRIFLSFLQAFFRDGPDVRFKWNADQKFTNIVISDKYAGQKLSNEQRPMIVLSRNVIRPIKASIKQRFSLNQKTGMESYMDLLQGSVTLNCLSKSGVMAEELAHIIMMAILSYRDDLRAGQGIHQILDIQIGEETLVEITNESIFVNVPVHVSFTKHMIFTPHPRLSTGAVITLTYSGVTSYLYEGINYNVIRDSVQTYEAIPSGYTAEISYTNALDMVDYTQTLSGVNGINTVFYTTCPIYANYPILWGATFSLGASGITYAYESELNTPAGPPDITYSGWFNYSGAQA